MEEVENAYLRVSSFSISTELICVYSVKTSEGTDYGVYCDELNIIH